MRLCTSILLCLILLQFLVSFTNIATCQDVGTKRSNQENLNIALSLIEKNEEDSALIYLNTVLSRVYNHKQALIQRAKIYQNKGQYEKSAIDYNALVLLSPDDKEIRYSRGLVRQNLSQYELAIEDYLFALNMPDGETNTAFFRIDAKENSATGISTISGMTKDILNRIGLCFHQLENFDQALYYFDEAIAIDPVAWEVYINRAQSYESVGEYDLAIRDYNSVLEKNPDHAIASFNLLQIEKNQKSNDDLLNSLSQYIIENPTIAEGYESRGLYYYEHMEYQHAQTDFQEAVKLDPSNIEYKFNLALAMEKNQQLSLAEIQLLKVIELDSEHSGAFFNLANIQFKSARYEEAISYYTIAHFHNPQNYYILYNRALAYFNNDQKKEACLDMKEVLKADESLAAEFCRQHCSMQ